MNEAAPSFEPVEPEAAHTQRRTCLLVLGMHRSGTSALARVLNIAGAELPNHLVPPGRGNELGHWEPSRLVEFHQELLGEMDHASHEWHKLDFSLLGSQRLAEIKSGITDLVRQEFGAAPLFVLKDPRICRLVPLYQKTLESADVDCRAIIIVRNPLEVCLSLEERDGKPRAEAAMLWLRHVIDAEMDSRSIPRVFIRYEDLIEDWRSGLRRIKTGLPLDGLRNDGEIATLVDEFLSNKYRHHACSSEDVRYDPILSRWAAKVWEALQLLSEDPNSQWAMDQISDIAQELDHFEPFLLDWLQDTYRKQRESERLKAEWFEPELLRLQALVSEYENTKKEWWDPEIARLGAALADANLREAEHYRPHIAELVRQPDEAQQELSRLHRDPAIQSLQELRQRLVFRSEESRFLTRKFNEIEALLDEETQTRISCLQPEIARLREEEARLLAIIQNYEKTKNEWWDPHIEELESELFELQRRLDALSSLEGSRIYRFAQRYYALYGKPVIGTVLRGLRPVARLFARFH